MKIRPVMADVFHADGRTGRNDEALVAFRNFANAPQQFSTFFIVSSFSMF
jgi:hypothetical protein